MTSSFIYYPAAQPNIQRRILDDKEARDYGKYLVDLMDMAGEYLLRGMDDKKKRALGFFTNEFPTMIGILVYNPSRLNPGEIKLMPNRSCTIHSVPYSTINLPEYMHGFRGIACFLNTETVPDGWAGPIRARLMRSLTTTVAHFWKYHRPSVGTEWEQLNALLKAPSFYKRYVMEYLSFPLFDPKGEDYISDSRVTIPGARLLSSNAGKIVFFVKKHQMTLDKDLELMKRVHAHNVAIIILDYMSADIEIVLDTIAVVDGYALYKLTTDLDVWTILTPKRFLTVGTAFMPRAETETRELAWTLSYSFAEGHITREEFEQAAARNLECTLCHGGFRFFLHDTDNHEKLRVHQAATIGCSLRKDLYPADEWNLVVWDSFFDKFLSGSNVDGGNFHTYTHLFHPGLAPKRSNRISRPPVCSACSGTHMP